MVRTIVIPESTHIQLDIPKEYVGKPMEITYLSLDELEPEKKTSTMGDFWGIISDETAKLLHKQVDQSRSEWERDI